MRTVYPLLICVYFLVLAAVYARAMPPFEAADEAAHMLYVHHLLEARELPRIASREAIARQTDPVDLWAIETHQPPLYYAIGALLISWTERTDIRDYLRTNDLIFVRGVNAQNHHKWLHSPPHSPEPSGDTGLAIMVLRGYSAVLGALTLLFVYRVARLLTGSGALSLLAMLLVASIPTFVSISASINNDNLVTLLYAAGVYMALHLWHQRRIRPIHSAILSLILAAIALTKITGLSLFGIVYLSLLIGVWRGYYPRRDALRTVLVTLVVAGVLAGWWYVRNATLYGDPLALEATQTLWGREFEIAATSGDTGAELLRIGRSFWAMVGHLHWPLYGPDWFFIYAGVVTLAGVIGFILTFRRRGDVARRPLLVAWVLCAVCVIVTAQLLVGTRSVDISYGRLLFPALVGFAPLLVWGWAQFTNLTPTLPIYVEGASTRESTPPLLAGEVGRGSRKVIPFILAPFVVMTLVFPAVYIRQAYAPLSPVERIPTDGLGINASAESVELIAYELHESVVNPGDTLRLSLYLRGTHPDNPALVLAAADVDSGQTLGQIQVYPGMAPLDAVDAVEPQTLYRVPLALPLNMLPAEPIAPGLLTLNLSWFDPDPYREIPITDGGGNTLDSLLLRGPVLVDPRYEPPDPAQPTAITFGDAIALDGYTLDTLGTDAAGQITLTLHWRALESVTRDWTVAVQVINDAGEVIAQADGMPPGYPTSAWIPGTAFTDTRLLPVDAAALASGRVLVGWYNLDDFTRLPARGDGEFMDNLLVIDG